MYSLYKGKTPGNLNFWQKDIHFNYIPFNICGNAKLFTPKYYLNSFFASGSGSKGVISVTWFQYREPCTHSFTHSFPPRGNLLLPIHPPACFGRWEETWVHRGNPCEYVKKSSSQTVTWDHDGTVGLLIVKQQSYLLQNIKFKIAVWFEKNSFRMIKDQQ